MKKPHQEKGLFPEFEQDQMLEQAGKKLAEEVPDSKHLEKIIGELTQPDTPEVLKKIGQSAKKELEK